MTTNKLFWFPKAGSVFLFAEYNKISIKARQLDGYVRAGFSKETSWEWGFNSDFKDFAELEQFIISNRFS